MLGTNIPIDKIFLPFQVWLMDSVGPVRATAGFPTRDAAESYLKWLLSLGSSQHFKVVELKAISLDF